MDTEKCRVLLRAVQLGSMSATSAELGYTPSGISYIIDTIEKDLGFKVVNRNQIGISLTQAGTRLLPFFEAMVDASDNLQKNAKEIRKDIGGEITIGTFPSIGRLILPDIMQEYLKQHPNVVINIVEGINEQLEQMIIRKEVDFCLSSAQKKGYDFIPMYEDDMLCVMAPENPLADRDVITADDLKHEKFIMPAYGRDSDVTNLMKKISLDPNVISYTLENSSAFAMIKRNMGVTIVNELGTIGTTDGLVLKHFDPNQYIVEGVMIKSYQATSPVIREFIDFMTPMVESWKPECPE